MCLQSRYPFLCSTYCIYEGRSESSKLICVFVFAYADCWFSHEAAHIVYKFYENQDDALRHNKNMFITKRCGTGTRSTPKSKRRCENKHYFNPNSLLFYFGKYYFVRKTPAVTDLQNRLAAVCMFIKNCVWCLL